MTNFTAPTWTATSVPPSVNSLGDGEVDLWRIDLDPDRTCVDSLFELLSEDEKTRADRYVFAQDRLRFVVGRGELRKIVGGYLGISPEKIEFSVRAYGKPYLFSGCRGLKFNVSHSQAIAVVAIARNQEVGVDIEFVDPNFDILSVAPSVFSASEAARIRSLPSSLRATTFFAGWTRTEACLKALGDGLSGSDKLRDAIRSLSENDVSFRSVEGDKIRDWSLASFSISRDFSAAVAVEGNIRNVRFWQWQRTSKVKLLPSGSLS